jgi:hypothetical protein
MKKLATLLITISLSVNAVGGAWYLPVSVDDGDIQPAWLYEGKSLTYTNIEGGFGMKLGATYNQDFLKPSYDFNTGGNWIVPSKPIDILSRYQLFVDDRNVAWQIVGYGEVTTFALCWDERTLLVKAINKKYGTEEGGDITDSIIARNFRQGRSIEVNCKDLNPQSQFMNLNEVRLTIIYLDNHIRNKYKETKENKRINSWDI